jgi:hypothetical protein
MTVCCRVLIVTSLLAGGVSTASVYPHELSFFNEFSGGPGNGYRHLLHSNLDWGQDLLFARHWMREREIPASQIEFVCRTPDLLQQIILGSPENDPAAWQIVSSEIVAGPDSVWQKRMGGDGVHRIAYSLWGFLVE